MKTARSGLAWLILLANVVMFGALSTHVVCGPDGWAVIAKDHLTLVDTYVDTRQWTPEEMVRHAAFVQRAEQARPSLLPSGLPADIRGPSVSLPTPPVNTLTTVLPPSRPAPIPARRSATPSPSPADASAGTPAPAKDDARHQPSIFDDLGK